MAILRASIRQALTPRGLEHWQRTIGLNRLEIQALQVVRHLLLMAYYPTLLFSNKGASLVSKGREALENRIIIQQTDTKSIASEVKCLMAELQQSLELFSRAPIGFHIINPTPDGIIASVNQRWLEILGYTKDEVIGRSIFDFIVSEQRANAKARYLARLAGQLIPPRETEGVDRQYIAKNGQKVSVLTSDTVIRNGEGKPSMVLTSFLDLTPLREVEKALRIVQMEKERSDFIRDIAAKVSHTERNLLGTLTLIIEDLKKAIEYAGIKEAGIHEMINSANDVIAIMTEYFAGILSVSRLKTNEMVVLEAKRSIVRLMYILKLDKSREGIDVTIEFDGIAENDGISIVEADFYDVLINLVNNAAYSLKNSGRDRKTITVKVEKLSDDTLRIVVEDNGVGINAEKLAKLSFEQMASSRAEGTGWGMVSVREKVVKANGTLSITSEEGEWTRVLIEFPRVKCESRVEVVTEASPVQERWKMEIGTIRVFLVDDIKLNRRLLSGYLKYYGFLDENVEMFINAESALEAYREREEKPTLFVTDVELPGMSGVELIEAIIGETKRANLPAFMIISGNPKPERDNEPGFNLVTNHGVMFLQKPCKLQETKTAILNLIEQHLAGQQ